MRPDASLGRRLRVRFSATLLQLWLEMKALTGGRTPWLAAPTLVWFIVVALFSRFNDDPWGSEVYYLNMMLLPGVMLCIALSMNCVMGARDGGQLETVFVSPTGRYQVWVLRFAAVLLTCWLSVGVLSLLTWLVIDNEHRPFAAWLQVFLPLLNCLGFTVFASLLFNSGAIAGLVSGARLVIYGLFGDLVGRLRFWFNPFDVPPGQVDPQAFFREIVANRFALALFAGVWLALSFWLLQRRERLL